MSDTNDILFEYIKNMIYSPDKACLDIKSLPKDYQKLGAGIKQLCEWAVEANTFAGQIAKGNINTDKVPSIENILAGNIKAIQATLAHMTWQTQLVAKGDYTQKVEYLGYFATAFNEMTQQLRERTTALENERNLFIKFTENAKEYIAVLDFTTGEILFDNKLLDNHRDKYPGLSDIGRQFNQLSGCSKEKNYVEWEYHPLISMPFRQTKQFYYQVHSMYILWDKKEALAHLFINVTKEKEAELLVKDMALKDSLTNMFNRRYAMDYLEKLISNRVSFSIAFIDIDYLKYCNDEFGHAEGDRYILQIARLLTPLTQTGIVCRVGGDEFLLICTDLTEETLSFKLENCRQSLKHDFLCTEKGIYKSFSYGVTSKTSEDSISIHCLLNLADERMYQYKLMHKQKSNFPFHDNRL